MKRKIVVVLLLLVAVAGLGATGFDGRLQTNVPTDGSVTSDKIADASIGYNPLQYDRGTRLDTPYVAICFDDGKDIWDSCKAWVDSGLVFTFGIPYNIVRDAVADSMTTAEVQEAFAMGCEITNHMWTGSANYLSRIGDEGMEKVIDRSVAYFLDTLKVGIPGTDPLQIGCNYAGGDVTEWGKMRCAERHVYGTGLLAVGTANAFENDSTDAVDCTRTFLRRPGNFLGGYFDTTQVSAFRGRSAAAGTTMSRVFRSSTLIWPCSITDQMRVPASFSIGPSPSAGGGTIQQLVGAKAATRFAMRNKAAVTFFFHHWDSVYTDGDPSVLWMSDFCAFLKEKEDSGLIKVVNVWDITRDYVLRPPASDWNFFPDPRCLTYSWDGNPARPDGWMVGGVWDAGGAAWHTETGADAGFNGDSLCASWKGDTGHKLIFARAVPPDCHVTFSCLVNASEFDGTADSIEVRAWFDVRTTDSRNQVGNQGMNQPATDKSYTTTSLVQIISSDRGANSLNQPIGVGGYPLGYATHSQGATHACRDMWAYNAYDSQKWKEILVHEYIPTASVVVLELSISGNGDFGAGEGMRFANCSFAIKRRLGMQPVRY